MSAVRAAPTPLGCLLLLGGCAGGAGAGEETGGAPSGWSWEGSSPEEAASAEDLSAAVQALIDRARTINAAPVLSSYYEAMSYSFEWCPEQTETTAETTGDMRYWDGVCEGNQSVWFKGPMTTWTWDAIDIPAGNVDIVSEIMSSSPAFDGYLFYGNGIRGQTDIYNPDSSIDFNCSCTAMQGMGMADDGRVSFFSFMDGPSHWTGSAADGTWMADGVRPGMWSWAEVNPDEDMKHVTLAGNLTGFAERFDTAKIDLTVFAPLDGSKACTAGDLSSFSLSIRDADTADWYELVFVIDDSLEGVCGACAPLETGEEVCVDLSPILVWESAPW